ncbi:hypothetical protein Q765_12985 [Flavobacterium rivuli WB 3.3-2 = DSM 21788]|uniref:Uncharacterized protein n=1 Tax=Flavobacterium rivuli WB 3.3-2 = DSM 21788 TaxID=1121895 RepID=A0A0A2M123_9FLAO|nr:hypothetical protein [Flavobacterium rivuli]KGO85974.1 hypothetical protein Q765_12985 [Flavobacterium rivuli WB 3.3-2 = DSM 21788]
MENLRYKFIEYEAEFISSNGSEKSIENLCDIVYILRDIEKRNFEENYILAKIYNMLGENIFALKIIDNALLTAKDIEIEKFKALQNKINERDVWNTKIYRDLRESKLINEPTLLKLEDFICLKDIDDTYYMQISDEIKHIVILNKNLKAQSGFPGCNFYSENEPDEILLQSLIEYIEWLGKIKNELLTFYNTSNFDYKTYNVGQEWFDGLNVLIYR